MENREKIKQQIAEHYRFGELTEILNIIDGLYDLIPEQALPQANIMRWRVIGGIFEGHEFGGHRVIIKNEARILDCETVGRSYCETDCVQVAEHACA